MPRAGSRPHSAYRMDGVPGVVEVAPRGGYFDVGGYFGGGVLRCQVGGYFDAQSWVERAGAREALVEGDLTPPPVDPLPHSRTHSLCRGCASCLSLSLPLSLV
jgi:hypothetical protein